MKDLAQPLPAGLRVASSLDGMETIHAPDCAAVICPLPEAAALMAWVAALPVTRLPVTRQILRPEAIPTALHKLCAPMPDDPERALFIKSIATLCERLAAVMGAPWLRLRLDLVTGNACARFHVDNVTARLVCTLRGTGTEFGLAEQGAEPEVIHSLGAGQLIILRGMRWPTTPPSLLKHRSPPIAGTGETRLLLVLDPILDPEDEI